MKLKDKIKTWLYQRRFVRKIKQAERLAKITHRKHYIYNIGKKLSIFTRKDLKDLIRARFFRKGTKIEYLETKALYTTNSQYIKTDKDDRQKTKPDTRRN